METPDHRIEQATQADVRAMMDRGNEEAWNQGIHDAPLFYNADPKGFWKVVSIADGAMLACVSGVMYAAAEGSRPFGFIGYYITRRDLRGRGLGLPLFQHALHDLAARGCETVGLDGVREQESNYVKSGFTTRYLHVRYEIPAAGTPGRDACVAAAAAGPPADMRLVSWASLSFADLSSLDERWFGAARPGLLHGLMALPEAVCFAAIDLATGSILGYGAVRRAHDSWRIGPLFVSPDSAHAGLALLHALAAAAPAQATVCVDVPEPATAALAALAGLGATKLFDVARMYTAGPPRGMDERVVWGASFVEIA